MRPHALRCISCLSWLPRSIPSTFCSLQVRENGISSESQLLFIGLSLGGALAQLTAYRVALSFSTLARSCYVLAFGPLQWATPPVVDAFSACFMDRAVQLVGSLKCSESPPSGVDWWVPIPPEDGVAVSSSPASMRGGRCVKNCSDLRILREASQFGAMEGNITSDLSQPLQPIRQRSNNSPKHLQKWKQRFLVVDPLASSFVESFKMMRNTILCNMDPGGDASRCGFEPKWVEYCNQSKSSQVYFKKFLNGWCANL